MSDFIDDYHFKNIRDLIYNASGINFTSTNRPILESRLKERLRELKIEKIGDYYSQLIQSDEELKNLLDLVTTNLTKFFRNATHFDALENHILYDLKEKKTNKHLKIWSAGCSTGEEPYSIAMVAQEIFDPSWKIEIIASDISFNALMKAKEGFYDKSKIESIPQKYLDKYIIKIGDGYYIKDDIKKLIQFDYHNLKNAPTTIGFDIVFCRNVLIYFDAIAQKKVVELFYNTMNYYAYFFIGHSESLFGMDTKFAFSKIRDACIYMKNEEQK